MSECPTEHSGKILLGMLASPFVAMFPWESCFASPCLFPHLVHRCTVPYLHAPLGALKWEAWGLVRAATFDFLTLDKGFTGAEEYTGLGGSTGVMLPLWSFWGFVDLFPGMPVCSAVG